MTSEDTGSAVMEIAEFESDIDVVKFVSIRKQEVDLLRSDAFLNKEGARNKSLFQLLPRHMRRRTMGYMRKRLPRQIRQAANIKPPKKANKRPSRKYRRRPANLVKEYERRKIASASVDGGEKMWLETHIWHAKRFHMTNTFGYRLADHDNCKCQRAVFKCLDKYSLIHDESYHVCLQLEGDQETLVSGLNRMCSAETGLTFAAKIALSGKCEGRTVLFGVDKYPHECLGPTRFLWKPVSATQDESKRTIWIWIHPAMHEEVKRGLVSVFGLSQVAVEAKPMVEKQATSDEPPQSKKRKVSSTKEEKAPDTNSPAAPQAVVSRVFESALVRLTDLKDRLVRFKLLGPMSTTVLANALQTVEPLAEQNAQFYQRQAAVWNKFKLSIHHPNEIPASTVLGLLVKDPRFILPKKKSFNKSLKQLNDTSLERRELVDAEVREAFNRNQLAESTLWNRDELEKLNKSKMTTFKINQLRSQLLLPGSEIEESAAAESSRVPVILVQSTTNTSLKNLKNGSSMCGWDLIAPPGWGMAFWLTLVHFGARAIGQKELSYLSFESGHQRYPNEYIDTKAGKSANEQLRNDLFGKYMRLPPSKRVNYLKNGFMSPFYSPVDAIARLNASKGPLTQLRNRRLLFKLNEWLFTRNRQAKINLKELSSSELELVEKSYIAVRLGQYQRGCVEKFSLLYASGDEKDEALLDSTKTTRQKTLCHLINQHRACVLKENGIDLKSIAKQPKSKETAQARISLNKLIRSKYNKLDLLKDEAAFVKFQEKMRSELGASYQTPIGFVVNSGFTLSNGKYSANGFILGKHILEQITAKTFSKDSNRIFYRAPNCLNSNSATIEQLIF